MSATAFQREDIAREFVDQRRAAIPFAAEQLSVMARVAKHFVKTPTRIVDLGCGDGMLSRVLLNDYPEASATLIDHSPPMLALAEESMAPFAGRYRLLEHDLADDLAMVIGQEPADIVVSGYAIHHLPDGLKRQVYESVFHALRPGGLFVNVEHVSPPTAILENLFDDVLIDNLVNSSGRSRDDVSRGYHSRPDKSDNILAPLPRQLSWLAEIGYENVDCYFKFLELAVFGGTKPSVSAL